MNEFNKHRDIIPNTEYTVQDIHTEKPNYSFILVTKAHTQRLKYTIPFIKLKILYHESNKICTKLVAGVGRV